MQISRIIKYPHPILRHKSKPLARVDRELKEMIARMFELMHETRGVGLAANQVGLPYTLFVMNLGASEEGKDEDLVFLNPTILRRQGMAEGEEGCLSLPEIFGPVRRPDKVIVSAYDLKGEEFTYEMTGLAARAVQHEYDHIEGVLFIDKLTESGKLEVKQALMDLQMEFDSDRRLGRIPYDREITQQIESLEKART